MESLDVPDAITIEVRDLAKRYGGDVDALRGISFGVGRGEVFGLLGPNGAGKSTTVEILTTLLEPTSGAASVLGFDVGSQPQEVRRVIGVALQSTGLDGMQTARGLLEFHGRLHGLAASVARDRAAELLHDVDLEEAADRVVGTFSGGMKRRLDLALALVTRPRVLFLDEPTTGLDPASRQSVWRYVEALREREVTILLTTQYLEEADRLADRVAILDRGSIIAEGSPEELKRAYGQDVVEVTLRDRRAAERAVELLGAATVNGSSTIRLTTEDGATAAADAILRLQAENIQSLAVSVAQPSLDDVFLDLTGRRLRSAGEEDEA